MPASTLGSASSTVSCRPAPPPNSGARREAA